FYMRVKKGEADFVTDCIPWLGKHNSRERCPPRPCWQGNGRRGDGWQVCVRRLGTGTHLHTSHIYLYTAGGPTRAVCDGRGQWARKWAGAYLGKYFRGGAYFGKYWRSLFQ